MTGKLPLNLFGIAFGLAALAGTWTAAATAHLAPPIAGDLLWLAAMAAWVILLVRYLLRASIPADLEHPVLGPFAALVPVTALLFGDRLASETLLGGRIVVGVLLVVATVYAGWFLAHLLRGGLAVDSFHPGYLLPTVATGLIGAQAALTVGWPGVAEGAFAVGILFWGLIGAALLARLALGPALPGAILPTMAIFSAPPGVAGNAWLAMDGGVLGAGAQLLLGATVVLLLLQVFLVPAYVRLKFSLGFWALTVPTATSATYGVHWLAGTTVPGWKALAWLVVAVATIIVGVIAVASVRSVVRSSRRHHDVVPVGAAAPVERAAAGDQA